MLRLKRLTTHNFGPFKGKQDIEFPETGIVILYGENMRGKTSFLNAIRYALFGKVVARSSREQSLHSLSNWEEAAAGNYGFVVELSFTNDGHSYVLTRSYKPRKGETNPVSDADYIEEYFLQKDGAVLGPDQRDLELGHIMPEQVARFFLFDGELLQEYEELLREDSVMGDRITKAIERILGVPILTNGRIDLRELHKKAQKRESLAAQKDQKTRELGTHLADLTEQRTYHEDEVDRLKEEHSELSQNKLQLERELRKTERIKAWLDELDILEDEVDAIEVQISDKQNRLQIYTVDAWRGLLGTKIRTVQKELEEERELLQGRVAQQAILAQLKKALDTGECPTCFQPIAQHSKELIANHIQDIQPGTDDDSQKLERLIYLIQMLQSFELVDRTDAIDEITTSIDQLLIDKATKEDRIREIQHQAQDYDQSKVRAQYAEHDKLAKEIALIEEGLDAEDEVLQKIDENIANLEKKLDEASGNDSSVERRRSELYKHLYDLFNEGVGVYRDELRKKVEKDATRIFLNLTSEPEYVGLQITDTYGLVIVHQDGNAIPVRSAGAEHIVALSLMGALQNNAPLQGPIIMDSPFGRLDETHTSKVIEALPSMTDQVFLLVYRAELDQQSARNSLKGNLKAEYKMVRQSARHTTIEKELEI